MSRRVFIRNTVRLAVAGAVIPGALAQALPVIAPAALAATGPGPLILRDRRTNAKRAVTLRDLAGTPPVVVDAEWNYLPARVYRIERRVLEASAAARGYNTAQHALPHPTEPDHVLLAYDGKCKHLGCPVGWEAGFGGSKDIPDYDDNGVNDGRIYCFCHGGQYDIHDLAKNQRGTPPPAPLDVIRFAVMDSPEVRGTPPAKDAIVAYAKLEQDHYRAADHQGDRAGFALMDPEAARAAAQEALAA